MTNNNASAQDNNLVIKADHISSVSTGEAGMVLVCVNTSIDPDTIKLRHVYDKLRLEDSAGEFDHEHTGFVVTDFMWHPDRAGFCITHISIAKV